MAPVQWIVGIVALLGACTKSAPTAAPAPKPAGATTTSAEPPAKGPMSWHTIAVADTEVQYATIGEPREGGRVLLALPPGPQTREMVVAGLELWADAMAEDGWFVISPVSPVGLLHTDSAALLPDFLDAVATAHAIGTEGLALFGMSNGGLSAFALAIDQPQRFAALLTVPGRPTDDDMPRLQALRTIPVTMIVGADDGDFWVTGAQSTKTALEHAGATVTLQLLPDTAHAAHLSLDWPTLRAHLTPGPSGTPDTRD